MSHIPTDLYTQIHTSMPIPCVDAVICHEGRVLLMRRTNKPAQGLFWFPGGRVLKNEHLDDAVRRKVREETGLEIARMTRIGTDETFFPDGPFGADTHTINVVYCVVPVMPEHATLADSQHAELSWFEELPPDTDLYVRRYFERALTECNLSQ